MRQDSRLALYGEVRSAFLLRNKGGVETEGPDLCYFKALALYRKVRAHFAAKCARKRNRLEDVGQFSKALKMAGRT